MPVSPDGEPFLVELFDNFMFSSVVITEIRQAPVTEMSAGSSKKQNRSKLGPFSQQVYCSIKYQSKNVKTYVFVPILSHPH